MFVKRNTVKKEFLHKLYDLVCLRSKLNPNPTSVRKFTIVKKLYALHVLYVSIKFEGRSL